jgi:signal transduction histidine kinase
VEDLAVSTSPVRIEPTGSSRTNLLTGPVPLPRSPQIRRVALAAALASLAVAAVSVGTHLRGEPTPSIAVAVVALAVAVAGLSVATFRPQPTRAGHVAALVIAAVAGAVLLGLFPATESFVIVCVAMGGVGMLLAPRPAFIAGALLLAFVHLTGLTVLHIFNHSYLVHGGFSVPGLISQDIAAVFTFAVGVFTRSTRTSQGAAREAQARAENLLEQLRASQAAQAEAAALTERARLAREIHDILAHALSGLVLGLDTIELLAKQGGTGNHGTGNHGAGNHGASRDGTGLDGAPADVLAAIAEQVARAQRIARDGLADTRRAIAALRGDELPGPALLDRLVAETAAATGIQAELTVTGEQRPLPPEIGLALYRTAQETLTNTAKYAGREGRAELRLRYTEGEVELAVEDARSQDAAPPAGLTFGGYGLTGIRERAELLGGRLTAGPTETGFKVLLRLPATTAPGPGAAT